MRENNELSRKVSANIIYFCQIVKCKYVQDGPKK